MLQQQPSTLKKEHPALQIMKFFPFLWVNFGPWIRTQPTTINAGPCGSGSGSTARITTTVQLDDRQGGDSWTVDSQKGDRKIAASDMTASQLTTKEMTASQSTASGKRAKKMTTTEITVREVTAMVKMTAE